LPRFGWQTVVVAPPRLPYEPMDEGLLERVPAQTSVYRIPYPEHWSWKPLRKLFPDRLWLPLAATGCYRAIRAHRPDAILTSGPPHGIPLLGCHPRRWTGLPWVADFRDPWVAGERLQRRSKAKGWEVRAEPTVMRHADAIVANTPGSRDLLGQAYPQYAAKMTSITNGYDPEPFDADPIPPRSSAVIEIVHTGEVYANRSPKPFLEAVQQLESAAPGGRPLRVRFIGKFGSEEQRSELRDTIRGGVNASVSLEDHVPYAQSIQAMV